MELEQAVWPSWQPLHFPIWRPGFESGQSQALTVKRAGYPETAVRLGIPHREVYSSVIPPW